jgi:chitin disaccharide deacetylase
MVSSTKTASRQSVRADRAPNGPPPFEPIPLGSQRRPALATGDRSVIVEADDLGLLYAFNEGIRQAYQHGVLTSTCLRANGYAYDHAVQEILPACRGLGLGVHLCLNEAGPLAARGRIPALLDGRGHLRSGFTWLMKLARSPEGLRQVEYEFRAQIEKVLGDGLAVDHLNSHQHVHMIPGIFRLTCRLAREYGIPCVRLARELHYAPAGLRKRMQPLVNSNYIKHLLLNRFALINEAAARRNRILTTDYFVGVIYTAHMNLNTILHGLRATPYGSVEILLHPAVGPDPRDRRCPVHSLSRYIAAPQRAAELDALRVPELEAFFKRETWMAKTFSTYAQQQQDRQPTTRTPEIPPDVHATCQSVVAEGPPWVSAAGDDSRAFAEVVITQATPGSRTLDIGTGTGVIAICVAKCGRDVTAVDISPAAVKTATANAQRNGVAFRCYRSDLLEQVEGRFDLIAFNPPYNFRPDSFAMNIAKNVLRRIPFIRRGSGLAIPRTVLRFHQQLIERLVRRAPEHLTPGGAILLHAYESEVSALASVLPADSQLEILNHSGMSNLTVGLLIRFPSASV